MIPVMPSVREGRLDKVQYLRDAAVRLARSTRPQGNVELPSGRKRLWEWQRDNLLIKFYEANATVVRPYPEISNLVIIEGSTKVLNVEWSNNDVLRILKYKSGQWESQLTRRGDGAN